MAITWRTATGPTSGLTTTVTWTLPTGHAADDLLIACYSGKPYTATFSSGVITTDYTVRSGGANGAVANGNGTGSNYTVGYTRVHDGSESNPTGTLSETPSPYLVAMLAANSDVTGSGWTVSSTNGSDTTTTGTTLSCTAAASLTFAVGDHLIVIVGTPDNAATPSALAVTAAGITFSAVTTHANGVTADGNDSSLSVYSVEVTAGSGAVAPVATMTTSSGDSNGQATFILIREPVANDFTGGTTALTETVTLTASATVARETGTTATAETVTLTATGSAGKSTDATATAETVTLTATGSTGLATGTTALAETVTLTSTGVVDRPAGTTATDVTVTLTAAGEVTAPAGDYTGGTTELVETVTLTSAGVVDKPAGTTALTETVTLSSGGVVDKPIGATALAETVTLTSAGVVAIAAGATALDETVTVTATGTVDTPDKTGGAVDTDVTVTLAASGVSDYAPDVPVRRGGSSYYPARPNIPTAKPVAHSKGAQIATSVTVRASGVVRSDAHAGLAATVSTTAAGNVATFGRAYLQVSATTRLQHDRTFITSESHLRRLRDDADLMLML